MGKNIPNDNWSMDQYFIENLNVLIQQYITSDFESDFEGMYKALKNLEMISSPKINNDSVQKNLEWLKNNLNKIIINDETGKVVGYNLKNKYKVQDMLDKAFRLLVKRLEDANIYTHKTKDPRKAMGNMGGS